MISEQSAYLEDAGWIKNMAKRHQTFGKLTPENLIDFILEIMQQNDDLQNLSAGQILAEPTPVLTGKALLQRVFGKKGTDFKSDKRNKNK